MRFQRASRLGAKRNTTERLMNLVQIIDDQLDDLFRTASQRTF